MFVASINHLLLKKRVSSRGARGPGPDDQLETEIYLPGSEAGE
jgi:hypothetical protein